MQLIKNFYKGQISLPLSFWIYFLFINLTLKIGTKTFTSNYGKPDPVIGTIWLLIIISYAIFSIIGTWRALILLRKITEGGLRLLRLF